MMLIYSFFQGRSDLLLFPDITVDIKKPKGHKDLWPKEAQSWVISKVSSNQKTCRVKIWSIFINNINKQCCLILGWVYIFEIDASDSSGSD